jgi:hypothetical protein
VVATVAAVSFADHVPMLFFRLSSRHGYVDYCVSPCWQ